MEAQTLTYNRQLTPAFFAGASHEDVKWTINYLMTLLEIPEEKNETYTRDVPEKKFSARINKLLSVPKREITAAEISDDIRLQSILER